MLSRNENTMESVRNWLDDWLGSLTGYPALYEWVTTHPSDRQTPLTKTLVVISPSDASNAREGELGGPLTLEPFVFNIDVLGHSEQAGRNISALIKEKLDSREPMPLMDYSTSTPSQTDLQRIDSTLLTRPRFTDPAPWQRHWFIVTTTITAEYNAAYLS